LEDSNKDFPVLKMLDVEPGILKGLFAVKNGFIYSPLFSSFLLVVVLSCLGALLYDSLEIVAGLGLNNVALKVKEVFFSCGGAGSATFFSGTLNFSFSLKAKRLFTGLGAFGSWVFGLESFEG
jgi:hypothetical protein